MKPGAYCRLDAAPSTMPGTGCMCSITQVAPEDLAITLVNIWGSTPNASPMRKASATAIRAEPEIKLLHNLATSPDPTAPTWMMLPPIAARAGRASSRSPASPPTMIANVPAAAPPTPPETAASPTDPARPAPSLTAASSAPGTTSKATTSKPFLTRLASIGCPIVPVPINPTFIAALSSNHQIAAIDGHRAAGHPAGFVGGEKQDSADDIFRLSQTAERDLRDRRAAP